MSILTRTPSASPTTAGPDAAHTPTLVEHADGHGGWLYRRSCSCGWQGIEHDNQTAAAGDYQDHVWAAKHPDARIRFEADA